MNNISTSIKYRALNLALLPPRMLFFTVYLGGRTCVGVAANVLATATFGKYYSLIEYSELTKDSIHVLTGNYSAIMEVVNPDVSLDNLKMGFLSRYLAKPIFDKACKSASNDKSILEKHVIARGAFAIGGIVAVVTKTIDLAIGIFAASISLVTLGVFKEVNQIALDHLSSLSLVSDLSASFTGIINPSLIPILYSGY